MKKIDEGCYVDESIQGNPSDIYVSGCSLPTILCHSSAEEAAARLISVSQQHNQWVGVSWERLKVVMEEDKKVYAGYLTGQEEDRIKKEKYISAVVRYRILKSITLGIYSLFVNKPEPPEKLPEKSPPTSGIYEFGESYVQAGIKNLMEHGFVRRISGDSEEAFFLTPKFVEVLSALQQRL